MKLIIGCSLCGAGLWLKGNRHFASQETGVEVVR